ncbi:MAG: hypothetical protein AB1330_01430 [Bacillota bacterium]
MKQQSFAFAKEHRSDELQLTKNERQLLRKTIFFFAKSMFEKKWPSVKTTWKYGAGLTVTQDKTPQQKFMVAVIKGGPLGAWRVVLVESNPAKVTDAKNKVMVYLEGPGEKRVGQVRRAKGGLDLIWFET